ncbi:methylated-DNA-[protein]-cysteine S-methyltransferase [Parabacteroides sp. PF5-5]|uniref:methylated-DNA--[protein]-cysteine S-methyltransferase n=1 Tax=unclassified Parabacteroides TaxID=2649774 RepID=UPI00247536AD|nr:MULTISPECIES: methylated-DNA--[protein]-cysteine S-methyltransferase [unclassified Parabacteroides]MDH6305727.1 methylated-DNA-[protein]-cysteine S-methyltransferase [Parabacteroides sp. PH5-39]MDH6316799.1 methylated-DNA-[protein]-cysteine S-methyltransferase [Parabacteroides sp. PF5-13]MDH6320440.1 methylated-DNA-[protein]-cysteine S-methyltransferase [Parabacteroides sp. PH5-13]MDH6324170.1 methylated-DNA-[protein]-cysteine S-methyltransferase [Parabacteroides sp. PH5-8]MDH6327985.1 meth
MEKKAFFYDTPVGRIGIAEQDGFITNVFFGKTVTPDVYIVEETPLLRKAAEQLTEYLDGKRKEFDLSLRPEGTDFERSCWDALLSIPYGETRTYGQQATMLGNPNASRAVGRANGRNPISIFIPCHRVIGSNGSLTGFAGGLDMKKELLSIEQSFFGTRI